MMPTKRPVIRILAIVLIVVLIWLRRGPTTRTVERTIDPAKLAEIALSSKDSDVCAAAIDKIAEPALLWRVATEAMEANGRDTAIRKLVSDEFLSGLSDGGLRPGPPVLRIISAFSGLPFMRRWEIAMALLPALAVFGDRQVAESLGPIETFKIERRETGGPAYGIAPGLPTTEVGGEVIVCTLHLSRISPIERTWSSEFPDRIAFGSHGVDAKIDVTDLLKEPFRGLPQAVLGRIASESRFEEVRKTAVEQLTDQKKLAAIYFRDRDRDVRLAAVKKIDDQEALKKIATSGGDYGVLGCQKIAITKIKDQAFLWGLTKDWDGDIRESAAAAIVDPAMLARLVLEHKDPGVRSSALWNITDYTLLNKLVSNDKDEFVRDCARDRLKALSERK
jgi:hypothetical protein